MTRFLLALVVMVFAAPAFAQGVLGGMDPKQPIEIDADKLDVFQAQNKAVFEGEVVAKQGTVTLSSDKMTVFYAGDAKARAAGNNSIKTIEAEGNVFIKTPQETAQGSKGVYDVQKNVLDLTGDVVLTRGQNVLKGSSVNFDMTSGRSTVASTGSQGGRVKGLFVPQGGQ